LRKLEDTGLNQNTLVIYCSDHGEMGGEHGLWGKSNYYEASAGVPIIASLPGVVTEGDSSTELCSLVDICPTIIEAAGADPIPGVDGRSLWPLLTRAGGLKGPGEIFSELGGFYWGPPSRMIRRGPWKLFKYHDETPPALFNRDQDPGETVDLGADPRHDDVRRQLLERLYDDWDPELVLRESARLDADLRVIQSWGAAVQPVHEDVLPIPDAESVTLL
jgi:choline-sulfatase